MDDEFDYGHVPLRTRPSIPSVRVNVVTGMACCVCGRPAYTGRSVMETGVVFPTIDFRWFCTLHGAVTELPEMLDPQQRYTIEFPTGTTASPQSLLDEHGNPNQPFYSAAEAGFK